MKLVHKNIEKDRTGTVALIPEDAEDMWHIYNLISEGDVVRASTIRKVQTESSTGSSSSSRVRTTVTIQVEAIDFDTQGCVLRLKGRNIEENPYIKMGAYHTIDIENNRKFTLSKNCWDVVTLERIDMACDPTKSADLAAIVMQEGIAHVCLVTKSMTLVRAKIDVAIPRKRKGNVSQHEKGMQRFFENVLQALLRHVNFDVVRCLLLASPGFVKDQFYEYVMQWALKSDNRVLLDSKSKFVLVHASSGFKHSLKEVLADPSVSSRLADTKATAEVRALENFYAVLQTEPSRAFYGLKHVEAANQAQAIEILLISDNLFRSSSIEERRQYVALVETVREYGGTAHIFSSLHVSGEQLAQLTGVAAILRFPMPELEDEELDSDSD
nr:EOG090X07BV [Eulimnadia texana]